jgi:signal transduction histidine kinase
MKRIIAETPLSQKDIEQFVFYLNLMETETRRISRIVSNLLAFSRQSRMEMTHLNLNRLIEQTLVLNANLLRIANVQVETCLAPGLPEVVGSEDQLQQVFMNLVSNAAQAMESKDGGVLRITSAFHPKDGQILIQIQDTGIGIPPEHMSKLFEPFFTTKKRKGVGLGLSVAYGIIQEHGGSIYVQSVIDKGATFNIKLPLHPPKDKAAPGGDRHG